MIEDVHWFVGIDWATQSHRVCLLDGEGRQVGERDFAHGGAGLTELRDWLLQKTGAAPGQIAWVYSALGEKDRAFFWLERALETRNYSLRDTLRSVTLSELRDDRRYADLLRRLLNVENAAVHTTATGRNET